MELNITSPKSWKELSSKQLIYISWLLTNGTFPAHEIQAYAFIRLTGIKVLRQTDDMFFCRYKKKEFALTKEEASSFSRKFTWITSEVTEVTPIPQLKKYSHVNSRLQGVPFIQYLALENYYQAYIFTKEEKYLNCLIAAFYTNNNSFNDNEAIARSKVFAKLPFHIRNTVFLWFYGLKSVLQSNYPFFFEKVESMTDEAPSAPNMREQMNVMIRSLTGGDVTKTQQIYNIETWTALAELNAKAREYKEMEKRMKKIK
jgi:hypothetical protein